MPVTLDIEPSVTPQRFATVLEDRTFLFDFRWNARAAAWFMDILTEDEVAVRTSIKVVLGMLGWRTTSTDFPPGVLRAYDTTGEGREAGLDDLGTRVVVAYYTPDEIEAL